MKTLFKTAAVYAVVTAIASAIVSQIMNGDPELPRTVTFGVVFGVTVASIHHWQKRNAQDESH